MDGQGEFPKQGGGSASRRPKTAKQEVFALRIGDESTILGDGKGRAKRSLLQEVRGGGGAEVQGDSRVGRAGDGGEIERIKGFLIGFVVVGQKAHQSVIVVGCILPDDQGVALGMKKDRGAFGGIGKFEASAEVRKAFRSFEVRDAVEAGFFAGGIVQHRGGCALIE